MENGVRGLNTTGGSTNFICPHSTMVSILASGSSSPEFQFQHSIKFFRGKNCWLAKVNQQRRLEASGQRPTKVDLAHLVLASGKLVVQKEYLSSISGTSWAICFMHMMLTYHQKDGFNIIYCQWYLTSTTWVHQPKGYPYKQCYNFLRTIVWWVH